MKRIAVLLSGNGVYDGSEIHESVITLLCLAEKGAVYQCIAPDKDQHHVINHVTGEEMHEKRNVFVEAARIARGSIIKLSEAGSSSFDALVMPGGFGAAKNFTKWAFSGPEGAIDQHIRQFILDFISEGKPIVALCMAPTVIAKALEESDTHASLTVGSTEAPSPYDIAAISEGMNKTGARAVMRTVNEISWDEQNNIITAPCYMMEASIVELRNNIKLAIDKLFEII